MLFCKARSPIAVLKDPDVFTCKAALLIAVLKDPDVLEPKARAPAAKLFVPVFEELKFVVEPIEMFVETLPLPLLKNTPLIEPVTVKEPEMFTVFAQKSPFINGTPEPDAMYNLLHSSVNVEGPAPNPIAILFEELPENKHPAC